MSAIAFIHGHAHTPQVWRAVADHLPPAWAVVAPDLFAVACVGSSSEAHREAMVAQIDRDLALMGLTEPVVVVAEGLGAIPAIQYAAEHPGRVSGIFLSGPKLALSRTEAMRLRAAEKLRRADAASASDKQVAGYLSGLVGLDERAAAERLEVARIAVVGEKDRGGAKGTQTLKAAGWEDDVVLQASADWYAYAPSAFAARVTQFAART